MHAVEKKRTPEGRSVTVNGTGEAGNRYGNMGSWMRCIQSGILATMGSDISDCADMNIGDSGKIHLYRATSRQLPLIVSGSRLQYQWLDRLRTVFHKPMLTRHHFVLSINNATIYAPISIVLEGLGVLRCLRPSDCRP